MGPPAFMRWRWQKTREASTFDLGQFEDPRPRLSTQKLGLPDSEFPFIEDIVRIPESRGPSWIPSATGARCRVVPKCSPGCSGSSSTSGRRSCGGVTSITGMRNRHFRSGT